MPHPSLYFALFLLTYIASLVKAPSLPPLTPASLAYLSSPPIDLIFWFLYAPELLLTLLWLYLRVYLWLLK